jgi:hypothetical protein
VNIDRIVLMLGIVFLFPVCGIVHAQTVREDVTLFDKPDGQPGAIRLKAGMSVKALKRQGFWVEVSSSGAGQGWLKISAINFTSGGDGPTAIDTGRLGKGNIVATSAARGLSAKDVLQGKPNYEDVARLEKLSFEPSALQAFRNDGGVQPVSLNVTLSPVALKAGGETGKPTPSAGNKKKGDGDDW